MPRDDHADEIRLDIPLDAPPWLVNREPRYVHPTLSDDEVIERLSRGIDMKLLNELLAMTPGERMARHAKLVAEIDWHKYERSWRAEFDRLVNGPIEPDHL